MVKEPSAIQVTVTSPVNCEKWLDEIEVVTSESEGTDVIQLRSVNAYLSTKVGALEQEVSSLKEDINTSEVEIELMSSDLVSVQQQLMEANEELTELKKREMEKMRHDEGPQQQQQQRSLRIRRNSSTSGSSKNSSLETESLKVAIRKTRSNLERERHHNETLTAANSELASKLQKAEKLVSSLREKNVILTDQKARIHKKSITNITPQQHASIESLLKSEQLKREQEEQIHTLAMKEAEQTISELNLHIEALQSTVRLYESDLSKKNTESKALSDSFSKKVQNLDAEFQSRADKNNSVIAQLNATLKMYESSLETATRENEDLHHQKNIQNDELNKTRSLLSACEQSEQTLKERLSANILRNKLETVSNNNENNNNNPIAQQKNYEEELNRMRSSYSVMELSHRELEKKYSDLLNDKSEFDNHTTNNSDSHEVERLRLLLSMKEVSEQELQVANKGLTDRIEVMSKKLEELKADPAPCIPQHPQLPVMPSLAGWTVPGIGRSNSEVSIKNDQNNNSSSSKDETKLRELQRSVSEADAKVRARDQEIEKLTSLLSDSNTKNEQTEATLRTLRNEGSDAEREIHKLRRRVSELEQQVEASVKKTTAERIELERSISEISQLKNNAEHNLQLLTEKMARNGKPRNDIRSRPPTGMPPKTEMNTSLMSMLNNSFEVNSSTCVGDSFTIPPAPTMIKNIESIVSDGYLRASPPPPTRDPSVETQAGDPHQFLGRGHHQNQNQFHAHHILLPGMDVQTADGPAVLVERYTGSDQRLRSRNCWWARLPNGEEKLRGAEELHPITSPAMPFNTNTDTDTETIIVLPDQDADPSPLLRSDASQFSTSTLG